MLELELEVLLTLVLEVLVTEDEVLLLLVTLVLLVVTLVELVELLVNVLELELLPGNHSFSPPSDHPNGCGNSEGNQLCWGNIVFEKYEYQPITNRL